MTPRGHPACVRRRIPVKSLAVHSSRALFRSLLLAGAFGLVPLPGFLASAAAAPAPATNANPASQSLLSRLPDPSEFKKNPLENVAKGQDPIANDPTFKDLQAAVKRQDSKTALNDLRNLTGRFPNKYSGLHELRGFLALRYHFVGEAENSFRQVTRIEPKAALGWYSLALMEAVQSRFPAAEVDARTSVKASDSFAPGWILLAICQDKLGQKADAVASATHATQVAPNKAPNWVFLARCKIQQGKQAAAVGDLEHARSIENTPLTNALLGSCYVQLNQPARAVAPYQQALKGKPGDAVICRQLGYCYLATGNVAAAEQVCRQGAKAQPGNAAVWDMLGLCYRREGKQHEAVDAFEHAVKDSPRDLSAREHLDEARLGTAAPRA